MSTPADAVASPRRDPGPRRSRAGVGHSAHASSRQAGLAAVGIITNDRLGFEGHQVGVAVVDSDTVKVDLFKADGLPGNERAVGVELGRQVAAASYDGEPNLLLLYDIVRKQMSEGLSLNMATPLLAGMGEALGGRWPVAQLHRNTERVVRVSPTGGPPSGA